MKKLIKISAVVLAVGLIMAGAGVFIARRDNVNAGSVYSVIEQNLKLNENGIEYTQPEKFDLGGIKDISTSMEPEYGLNEFNTLSLYTNDCDVEFLQTHSETMTAKLYDGTLATAIKGGTLYVNAQGSGKSELTIGVPEIFKGALVINAVESRFTMGEVESAMDVSLTADSSVIEAQSFSADSLDMTTNGCTFSTSLISVTETFRVKTISSELHIDRVSSQSSSVAAQGGTVIMENVTGGFTADTSMTTMQTQFQSISSNIEINVDKGSAEITVPSGSPLELRHDEHYGIFSDKTEPSKDDPSIFGGHYVLEANVNFGIVKVKN